MSEFLSDLPADATMGNVFDQVYTRVESLITELDARRVAVYGEGSSEKLIPDTEILMNWSIALGEEGETFRSTHLDCAHLGNALLSLDTITPAASTARYPSSVTGYRGSELSGDYSLRERQSGLIQSRLGRLGLFRGRAVLREDEKGLPELVSENLYTALNRLNPVESAQLYAVTRGILDNITAVELLRDGAAGQEVFEMMDRKLVRY